MHAGGMMTTKQQQASISSAVSKYFLQITLQINLCNKDYQQILKADEEALSLSLSLSLFLLFCLQAILKMKEMSEILWVVLGFVAMKDRKTDKIRCGRNAMDSKGDSTISNSTHFREYSSLMDFGPKMLFNANGKATL
jgi:hypothetical protein